MTGFYLLILLNCCQCFLVDSSSDIMTEATIHALVNSFNKFPAALDVTFSAKFCKNMHFFVDILEEILKLEWNFKINLEVNNDYGSSSISDYNVLFIESYTGFQRLFSFLSAHKGHNQVFFLIVLRTTERPIKLMQDIFEDMFSKMLDNVNILIETPGGGSVEFYTFFPYQKSSCRSTAPMKIHHFPHYSTNTRIPSLFPSKFKNIHGCPMRIITRNLAFFRKIKTYNGYQPELLGLEIEMLNVISAKMNFKKIFKKVTVSENTEVFPNGTALGLFNLLKVGYGDFLMGFYLHGPVHDKFFTPSIDYLQIYMVIAILRPPFNFRTFSWLFVPFKSIVWLCNLMILIVVTVGTFVVSRNPNLVRFLQLQDHRPRLLHILAVAIGLSIESLPRKNFLRQWFIIWSLGALTIRAIYQGKLFDSYRNTIVKQIPLTVQHLSEQHYTIILHNYYKPVVNELTGTENLKFIELTVFDKLQNMHPKSAIVSPNLYFYVFYSQREIKELIMKPLFTELISMYFLQHSSIADVINSIIMRMDEAGLLLRWKEHFEYLNRVNFNPKKYIPPTGPIVLSRFKYILYLFSALYAACAIVFVMELLWAKFWKKK